MVNEFNKIVFDMLATEGAVHLPDIGTLVVVRRAAERMSSRRLRRSCNAVLFTDKKGGRSVVDAVAEICGVDGQEAQEIYRRWLSKSTDNGVLAIDGVGHIDRNRFFVDDAFDKLLNPNGHDVVELVKCRNRRWLKIAVSAVVLLAAAGCAVYWSGLWERRGAVANGIAAWFAPKERPARPENGEYVAAAEPAVDENAETEAADAATGEQPAPQSEDNVSASSAPAAEPAAVQESESPSEPSVRHAEAAERQTPQRQQLTPAEPSEGIGRMTSGRSYVVYGVFSTSENALRAVGEVRAGGVSGCSAFAYGPKYMVALYFSDDAAECNAFIRSAKEFENLWVYTAH